jgi:hypothetical protein
MRIQKLQNERAQLWALRWRDANAIARLIQIRAELEKAWDARRLEKSGIAEGDMPDNVRSIEEFAAPREARRAYRSRKRRGLTLAQTETLALGALGI